MHQFRNNPLRFNELRRLILAKSLPLLIITFIVTMVFMGYRDFKAGNFNIAMLPIGIVAVAIVTTIVTRLSINRQRKLYESYVLTLDGTTIIREQENTPTIKLDFSDIRSVVRPQVGGLVIIGNSAQQFIIVAAQLNGLSELETILQQHFDIQTVTKKPILQKLTIPIVFAVLGMMAVVYASDNKIAVGCCGSVMIAVIIYSSIAIQRNKNLDKRTKRLSYWSILVLLSIIVTMAVKLSA